MPPINGDRLDQHQRFAPPGAQPSQEQPKQAVSRAEALIRTSENAELVAGKRLEDEVSAPRARRSAGSTRPHDGSHRRRVPIGDADVNDSSPDAIFGEAQL
jgi:hypothetical protein